MEPIPIDPYLNSFKRHLDINERIILSAKFGDGKTYYLDKFKKKYETECFFITLYPVNYSVSNNADIFEYIKRDIILQLSKKEEVLLSIDFEAIESTLFSLENITEVISFLLSSIPGGDFYSKLLKKGIDFHKKYEDKKKTGEKFIKTFSNQKGGIYECDGYTKLIEEAVKYIQKTQKVVLIIEDLDRIDPAHLFRILNVLGAHIDCKYYEGEVCTKNKFGIDNIITVFDYDTTEHIFHHFYGIRANYQGYINKFKINTPFYYSINNAAKKHLLKFIIEKCQVPEHVLSTDQFRPIYSYINELSVRDIQCVLNDIEKQIIKENISVNNNTFSSISPLTLFITLLLRIGVKKEHILSTITYNIKDHLLLLNLVNTFLLFDADFSKLNSSENLIRYGQKYYAFTKDINKEEGVVVKLSFADSPQVSNPLDTHYEVSGIIDSAINKALNYVSE